MAECKENLTASAKAIPSRASERNEDIPRSRLHHYLMTHTPNEVARRINDIKVDINKNCFRIRNFPDVEDDEEAKETLIGLLNTCLYSDVGTRYSLCCRRVAGWNQKEVDLIVRFENLEIREFVYRLLLANRDLAERYLDQRIEVHDELTAEGLRILKHSIGKFGKRRVYVYNGKVHVFATDSQIHCITTLIEFRKLVRSLMTSEIGTIKEEVEESDNN